MGRRQREAEYSGDTSGQAARAGVRVARARWVRKAVKAPSNATARDAWSPWDRRSQQGTGGCARLVGGAAGVATARNVARGREHGVLLT
jgi:hypothetical protein